MLEVGQEVTIRKDLVGDEFNSEVFKYLGQKTKIGLVDTNGLCKLEVDGREMWWNENLFEPITDNVNHPSHYQQGGKETIETIKDTLASGFNSYLEGNIIKYISRYKFKNGVEDLKKAQFYLNRLIKEVEGGEC